MDEGDLDIGNNEGFSAPDGGDQMPSSCSMDSFFDDIFKDTHACTHTHTCNPPGPDLTHTHTCFHVHTKIVSAPPADETAESTEKTSGKKRSFGNREAVRKYREKKKAREASLEDENRELRKENQMLVKKVQSLASLEADNMRLKCLLVDLRGRIDGEIGAFPYRRPGTDLVSDMGRFNLPNGAQVMRTSCNMRCDDQLYCMNTGIQEDGVADDGMVNRPASGVCELSASPCLGGSFDESKGFLGCERGNLLPNTCDSSANGRKGARANTKF